MRNERDVWNKTVYHLLIQEKLGKALSAGYDLSQPLPDRLSTLLGQLDEATSALLIAADEPATPPATTKPWRGFFRSCFRNCGLHMR
jgi:hypothetical protein